MGEFNERCAADRKNALMRMAVRYSRQPEKRQEQRLEMNLADLLESRRGDMIMLEFSSTWNKRDGEAP